MGLVKGFTDILTPVNLLTNSDFSRGGGIPSPLSISSLAASSSVQVAEGWALYASGVSLTNATVTRSNSKITISGTINGADGTWHTRLILQSTSVLDAGKIYTMYTRFSKSSNMYVAINQASGSATNLYSIESTEDSIYVVKMPDNATNHIVNISIFPAISGNVPFEVTIYDSVVYEGAFCNPPITKSLDRKPGIIFDKTENLKYKRITYNEASEHKNHWVRMCPLTFGVTHNAGRLYMVKNYTPHYDASLMIEFICNNTTNSDGSIRGFLRYVSSAGRGMTFSQYISKLRIGKTSAYSQILYLEGFIVNVASRVDNFTLSIFYLENVDIGTGYYGGSMSYLRTNNTYNSLLKNELYQICDNDVVVSGTGELALPNVNGFQ